MKSKEYEVRVNKTLHITAQDIDDIMCSALDGGITYWCDAAEVFGDYLGTYSFEQISRGGTLILHDAESEDKWSLDAEKLLEGIKLWYENGYDKYNAVYASGYIDTCQIDGEAADIIIQYALFGDIVFG